MVTPTSSSTRYGVHRHVRHTRIGDLTDDDDENEDSEHVGRQTGGNTHPDPDDVSDDDDEHRLWLRL